jgi:hypothetical protein
VPDNSFPLHGMDRDAVVRSAIRAWRDGLINLTRSNRMLNFRPSRTSTVEIVRPSPEEVLARVVAGRRHSFRSLAPGKPDVDAFGQEKGADAPVRPPVLGILDTEKPQEDLAAALRSLSRRSSQEYLDRGVWVLYFAFGTLTWTDVDKSVFASPLLLVPVRLVTEGSSSLPVLEPTEDDPVVNPVLALKLSRYGITLPGVDALEDVKLSALLSAVSAAVAGQEGWEVTESLLLSYFSFTKEAMYRDLLEHEGLIAGHPAISALAAGGRVEQAAGFYFDEIPEHEIDQRAVPEKTPVILDADCSQRASIAAVLAGRSFVMDGPPGTGKSQTIANMIGVLLQAGKTVLFVSEKAAALDVVRDRLDGAGLRSYLLELHSHKATRKQVATALGAALDTVPVAPSPMPPLQVDTARKRREELNAYADAMNRPREPLGYPLHDVLGMISQLHDVPVAPATGIAPTELTVAVFGDIQAAAARLAGAWRPAAQGRSFLWRGVTELASLESRLYQAASALEALQGIAGINAALAEASGLTRPSDADALAVLAGHLSARPPGVPGEWLEASTLDHILGSAAEQAGLLAEIEAREAEVTRAAGVPCPAVPRSESLPDTGSQALGTLAPPALDLEVLTADQLTALARRFAADADMLEQRLESLVGLAGMLGLRAPLSFAEADDVLAVAALAWQRLRPERWWLSPSGLEAATEAARRLYQAHQEAARAEAAAGAYYTSAVLSHDADGLARRFADHHRLGVLSSEYRADKKAIAAFTRSDVSKDAAAQHLPLAAEWKRAIGALAAAESMHAPVLGAYYAGRQTDFGTLSQALDAAAVAVRSARGQDLTRAGDHLARDARPSPAVVQISQDTRDDLSAWQASLAPRPASAARPELLSGTFADAAGWLRAHLQPFTAAASYVQAVSGVVGAELTLAQARYLVCLRDAAEQARHGLAVRDDSFTEIFGALYAGALTDISAVQSALEWTQTLRRRVTGGDAPLTPVQIKAAEDAMPASHLAAASERWQQARHAVLAAFDADRQQDLAAELDDYRDAADLIAALQQDSGGKEEWQAYQAARAALAAYGLDVAVDFCISQHVPPEHMPAVLIRALLQEWAEHHLRTDPDLAMSRAADRDALITEYQELDRSLIAAATGDIIRACNARRPRSDVGESAVIRREAEKKKKHMPVRTLIERTRHVTQAVKPCFMMSPLAVSQYLPSDIRFDVVIFDEASQVSPGDAINCIYRGSALILAGDQKQLPPTNFFAGSDPDDDEEWSEESDDTADFESILDLAKGSGAYRSLTLRWHYRSRHEALIAFSNASFYEGKLVTFPSRHSAGPDVGVELFPVDGTYRRGTTRDNPDEAAAVAERVIHHYDTRPGLSLGVITFSEAQAEAIEAAVSRARQDRPDLDRFFGTDRLRGFFVKNLESVQGDERDVLIFSIGYGPDENRKITMNFGPLNKQGGWRRLNVAITRARYRNEIVSSIHAGDIPEYVTSEGLRHLRRYLDYAARGMAALALDVSSGGDAESPFEESVIAVIRSWGYEVAPQVGTAGYRIDIGIRHPGHPGVYALGVECDGYQYHSSKVARDRDRLRETVLRGLGWNLHRIWGTAWHRDRNGEERKLRAAIENAIAAPVHGLLTDLSPDQGTMPVAIRTEAATFDATPSWATPYVTARIPPLPHWVDPGQPGSHFGMSAGIREVAMTEAPVHIAVLQQRLRDAWNIGRIGSQIRSNIEAAIKVAGVLRDGEFICLTGAPPAVVRKPVPACQRSIDQIHDHELRLAMVNLVSDAGGISYEELTTRIARLYGWNRRGPDITNRMNTVVDRLLADGALAGSRESLTAET